MYPLATQSPPTYISPQLGESTPARSTTSQLEIGKPIGTLVSASVSRIDGSLLQSKYVQSPDTFIKTIYYNSKCMFLKMKDRNAYQSICKQNMYNPFGVCCVYFDLETDIHHIMTFGAITDCFCQLTWSKFKYLFILMSQFTLSIQIIYTLSQPSVQY